MKTAKVKKMNSAMLWGQYIKKSITKQHTGQMDKQDVICTYIYSEYYSAIKE